MDIEQISEETAQKTEREMTLTYKDKTNFYGSRDFWVVLFKRLGLENGKLTISPLSSKIQPVQMKPRCG